MSIGKIDKTKHELNKHFEKYKQQLIKNNLEVEFERLIFLKKENAIQELDNLPNYKRPFLRDLIEEAEKY